MYDCIVIGAGVAGLCVARSLADKGKKIHVIEKRNHIAGNCYECYDESGIRIHKYGPHIFHTSIKEVMDYLQKFSDFYPYKHKVVGLIDGKLVPIPFNFTSLYALYEKELADKLVAKLTRSFDKEKVSILELLDSPDEDIKKFGEFVYEKVFVHYTAKQWGIPISEVDTSVINRVPVVLGYEDGYFADTYQYMPSDGFTVLFENMANHPNISIELGVNAVDVMDFKDDGVYFKGEKVTCPVIHTGAIDELLGYRFGVLPYRSLNLVFESYEQESFQPASVVNYPNSEDFTRITEFKYLTRQSAPSTTILKEYPAKYDAFSKTGNTPYYSIENKQNRAKHDEYANYLKKYGNVYLLGRLAEYKYYNIDACVKRALEVAEQIKF